MARHATRQPATIRRYDVSQESTLLATKRTPAGQELATSNNLLHATNGFALPPQCLPWPNSSFANKPKATMIRLPPAYVASDGSRPKRNQSATATKKTLNLKEVSTQGRKWRARNDSH